MISNAMLQVESFLIRTSAQWFFQLPLRIQSFPPQFIIASGITSLVASVLDMFLDYRKWKSSQSDTSSVHGRIKEPEQRANAIPSHDIVWRREYAMGITSMRSNL